jgi:thiol-disulfide isomerase/thioredoxin
VHLTTLEGQPLTLRAFRGRVVLVNHWATWCPPCRAEMPTLDAYYRAHAQDGLVLIAIAAHQSPAEVRHFLKRWGFHPAFIVAPDPQEQALRAFHQTRLPASYVLDKNGVVRWMWVGAIDTQRLERVVTPLLEKKP